MAEERLGWKSAENKGVECLDKDLISALVARCQGRKQDKMTNRTSPLLPAGFAEGTVP